MAGEIFDMKLRAMRRDRAFRRGPDLFLHNRAFADCLERLELVARTFRSALLVGSPDPAWPAVLQRRVAMVEAIEPGPLFAAAANARCTNEDSWTGARGAYDLVVAIGTLDTVNDLPAVLRRLRDSMSDDALLMGAIVGGDSLPQLRSAMFAADRARGAAAARVHPRIDAPSLAALLGGCGFVMPVVDVERIELGYSSLSALVADLRSMGATNVLAARERRPVSRSAMQIAVRAFAEAGANGRTREKVEILNFAAWTPAKGG